MAEAAQSYGCNQLGTYGVIFASIGEITKGTTTKIHANVSGKIISILVQNGEKVDQGQPIMLILSDE